MKVFASACGQNDLHFISDEIYAKSTFQNQAIRNTVPFQSTLSLDFSGIVDETRHHIIYGASKDFCANGLRLGLVCTRNEGVMGALSSIRYVCPLDLTETSHLSTMKVSSRGHRTSSRMCGLLCWKINPGSLHLRRRKQSAWSPTTASQPRFCASIIFATSTRKYGF